MFEVAERLKNVKISASAAMTRKVFARSLCTKRSPTRVRFTLALSVTPGENMVTMRRKIDRQGSVANSR